ncbi:MAG: hypothetical protein MR809_09345 [Rikenellaceae bacterium]|nr:hypothetical protein [Rikenellaceae bacterium]
MTKILLFARKTIGICLEICCAKGTLLTGGIIDGVVLDVIVELLICVRFSPEEGA